MKIVALAALLTFAAAPASAGCHINFGQLWCDPDLGRIIPRFRIGITVAPHIAVPPPPAIARAANRGRHDRHRRLSRRSLQQQRADPKRGLRRLHQRCGGQPRLSRALLPATEPHGDGAQRDRVHPPRAAARLIGHRHGARSAARQLSLYVMVHRLQRRAASAPAMIIDLLDLDLAAGKHWIDLVTAELRAQRRAEMRAKNRAAWLDKQGRHAEAERVRAGGERLRR
jgi:hypothetical protein